jgi:hypothetical protein
MQGLISLPESMCVVSEEDVSIIIHKSSQDFFQHCNGIEAQLLEHSRYLALDGRVSPKFLESNCQRIYRMSGAWELDESGLVPGECLVPVREVVNSDGQEVISLIVVARSKGSVSVTTDRLGVSSADLGSTQCTIRSKSGETPLIHARHTLDHL